MPKSACYCEYMERGVHKYQSCEDYGEKRFQYDKEPYDGELVIVNGYYVSECINACERHRKGDYSKTCMKVGQKACKGVIKK